MARTQEKVDFMGKIGRDSLEVRYGAGDALLFEPLISHFEKLRIVYQKRRVKAMPNPSLFD